MLKFFRFIPLLGLLLFFFACKKDVKIEPQAPAPVKDSTQINDTTHTTDTTHVQDKAPEITFDFKGVVSGNDLAARRWYLNAAGDSFTVSKFNYYISNIRFKKADGTVYAEPESYHLNKHLENKTTFNIAGLPEGEYTSVEFLIGVDSARNVSGAQTGALDVGEGMFWEWNTGYVFMKLEGQCSPVSGSGQKGYSIHVGGFSGVNNCLQRCTFNLTTSLRAQKNHKSQVFFETNVEEIFENPNAVGFDNFAAVSGGKQATVIADNYKDMFRVVKVEN